MQILKYIALKLKDIRNEGSLVKVKAEFQKNINKNDSVICLLCPHKCKLSPGQSGLCRVRKNIDGILYSINYGKIRSAGVDPMEKNPLYHFYPGSSVLSLGTFGCNFSCDFCQNWRISQKRPETREMKAEEIIDLAEKKGVKSIAYTYSEPVVWYEFIRDSSKLAHKKDIKNVLVTNGYINNNALKKILPYIDAANVDLKSYNEKFYKKYTGGSPEPVKNTIKMMANNIDLEVTTLVIGGLNDGNEELEKLFSWLGNINSSIPLHLSRYFPAYNMNKDATDISTMKRAYKIANKYLDFVYLGNMKSGDRNNTYCPNCSKKLITRNHFKADSILNGKNCPECGYEIYGSF